MNRGVGVTSGRRSRSLALLFAYFALVGLTSTSEALAKGGGPAVSPSQELAALLSPHVARAGPSAGSAPVGVVPAATPVTEARTVLPVLARNGRWLKVRLPGRPNGHTGWIRRTGTIRSVTYWHLVVNPSRRQVIVYRAGRRVRVFRAIVGKPSTPTPPGKFFVEESVALRADDVGAPFALLLSARSNVLHEFAGGPGQIAMHGLANIGGVLGTAASHGCLRLGTNALRWLALRIGPGVPVTITG